MTDFHTRSFDAVLFDLDGTLIDTAPDMVAVLQAMQRDHDVTPVDYDLGRSNVSNGAIGLLKIGFPDRAIEFNSPLHLEYLERYEGQVCEDSVVFDGLELLLAQLEAADRVWGIVTNKPERMTHPLLRALDLDSRSAATVCGDTLPTRKPDPAPMHHACSLASVEAERTVYVGDALRDIEAGRAAGMGTIAAGYGYVTADDDPASWGADLIADDVAELTQMVLKAVNLEP